MNNNKLMVQQDFLTAIGSSVGRMWAISLRHIRQTYKDVWRFVNIFFWPVLNMIIWGFNAKWIQSSYAHDAHLSLAILTALIGWQVSRRAVMDVSIHLFEEISDRNIANIFSTPLSIFEWVGGIFIMSMINVTCAAGICIATVKLCYDLNVLNAMGFALLPFLISLFIAGLSLGFVSAAPLLIWGRRVHGIIFVLCEIFAPFSGAFYPISVLPSFLRMIAQALPMSYAIEGIRQAVMTGVVSWRLCGISFLMSLVYFVVLFTIFVYLFGYSKNKGLERLAD